MKQKKTTRTHVEFNQGKEKRNDRLPFSAQVLVAITAAVAEIAAAHPRKREVRANLEN